MVGRVLAKDEVGVRFSLSALEYSKIRLFKRHFVDNLGDMWIKDVLNAPIRAQ